MKNLLRRRRSKTTKQMQARKNKRITKRTGKKKEERKPIDANVKHLRSDRASISPRFRLFDSSASFVYKYTRRSPLDPPSLVVIQWRFVSCFSARCYRPDENESIPADSIFRLLSN